MATLDATQVPKSSASQPQSPDTEWDIDGADEIPAEGLGATSKENAPALADAPELTQANSDSDGWDLGDVSVSDAESVQSGEAADLDGIQAEAAEDTANALDETAEAAESTEETQATESTESAELPASEENPEASGESSGESEQPSAGAGEVQEATRDDILAEIVEAEKECERAAAVVEALKSRQKEAKEDLAAAVNRLRRLAREIGEDYERPLLNQQAKKPAQKPRQQPEPAAAESTPAPASAGQKEKSKVTLENGGIPVRVKCLVESPDYPQLIKDSDHDVLEFYVGDKAADEEFEEFTVSIQDPAKEDSEIFLGVLEYDVLEWLGGDNIDQEEMRESEVDARIADTAAAAGPQEEDESWRDQRLLEDIGLAPNLCQLLADNPGKTIKTLGHLTDWGSKGHDLTDIPKVGPAKVDKINDALDKFWKRWNAK